MTPFDDDIISGILEGTPDNTNNTNNDNSLQSYNPMQDKDSDAYKNYAAQMSMVDWIDNGSKQTSMDVYTPTTVEDDEWSDYKGDDTPLNITSRHGMREEMEYEDQGFFNRVLKGSVLFTTTAASTFVDGIAGLIWGGYKAISEQKLSGLWDNEVTNCMADFNDWCHEQLNLTESKYDGNIWNETGNFIARQLDTAGFQAGTAASIYLTGGGTAFAKGGAALAKGLAKFGMNAARAQKYGMMTADICMNVLQSAGEASIEALGNKRDFVKEQTDLLESSFSQKNKMLDDAWELVLQNQFGGDINLAKQSTAYSDYLQQKMDLEFSKKNNERFIQKEAEKVGDITFIGNMAILSGTNFLTFGKALAGGYGTTKRFAGSVVNNIVDKEGKVIAKNVSDRTAKNVIRTGLYNGKAANIIEEASLKSKLWQTAKDMIVEGSEEMAQGIVTEWAKDIVTKDILNYNALTEDQKAKYETANAYMSMWKNLKNLPTSASEVLSDPKQWEQFIGGAIGVIFAPHFSRKQGGGIELRFNHLREMYSSIDEANATNTYIADRLTNIFSSEYGQSNILGLLRHNAFEGIKRKSVAMDSKMDFEDADHGQLVSDIAIAINAGKGELLSMRAESALNLSDEELKDLCMTMTTETEDGKIYGEFVDSNGNFVANTPEKLKEVRHKIENRANGMKRTIDTYINAINKLDRKTAGILNTDDIAKLAWEQCQIANKYERANFIIGSSVTAPLIDAYKNRIGSRLNILTESLDTTKTNLQLEKERAKIESKKTGKEITKTQYQEQLENDFNTLTQEVKIATELSQLITDIEKLQITPKTSKELKNGVCTLFAKYQDFAKIMPELSKAIGIVDDKGNHKLENGKPLVASFEGLLRSENFFKFLNVLTAGDIESNDIDNVIMDLATKDFADAAYLYRRATETEKSMEEITNNPEQFVTGIDSVKQGMLERLNAPIIDSIVSSIQEGIDKGEITYKNLDEKSREIANRLSEEKNKREEHKRIFDNLLHSVNNTPYEELRKIAIDKITKNKKNKHIKEFEQFVNTIYMQILSAPNVSGESRKVAITTFNKNIEGKTNIDDVLSIKTELEDFDVSEILEEVPEAIKNRRLEALKLKNAPQSVKDTLPFDISNYMYTEGSVEKASVIQNEAKSLYDSVLQNYTAKFNGPKLANDLSEYNISDEEIKKNGEEEKRRRDRRGDREKISEKISEKIDSILSEYKNGERLFGNEAEDLETKIFDYINQSLDTEKFSEDEREAIENLKINKSLEALRKLNENIKTRIQNSKRNDEADKQKDLDKEDNDNTNRVEKYINSVSKYAKIAEAINKALDDIKKIAANTQSPTEASRKLIFDSSFDKIATADKSVSVKKSKDGYYTLDGKVYRGHIIPCSVRFNGSQNYENHYANYEKNKYGEYDVKIINKEGQIIGKSKSKDIKKAEFSNANRVNPSSSLSQFAEMTLDPIPVSTTPAEDRLHEAKAEAINTILEESGVIDEKGEAKIENLTPEIVATINVIADDNIVAEKADIEEVQVLPSEIKVNVVLDEVNQKTKLNINGKILQKSIIDKGGEIIGDFTCDYNEKDGIRYYSNISAPLNIKMKSGKNAIIGLQIDKDSIDKDSINEDFGEIELFNVRKLWGNENVGWFAEGEIRTVDGSVISNLTVKLTKNPLQENKNKQISENIIPIAPQPIAETNKKKKSVAKKSAEKLGEQIQQLESMIEALESRKKDQLFDDETTIKSLNNLRTYISFVKDNYEQIGSPNNVVLDSNTVNAIVDKLSDNLKDIFGDDFVLLSSDEIDNELQKNNNFQLSASNKNENLTFNVIDNQNNEENDRRAEENIRQRVSLATGRIGQEASRAMVETANDIRRVLQNVERGKDQIRYDSRGLSERELILERLEAKAKENGIWIEDVNTIASINQPIGSGSESNVYNSKDNKSVIKLNSFPTVYTADDIYSKLMDRIASHNELFKNCVYEIIGFTKDKDGNVCIALKQARINIDHFASKEEIEAELIKRCFKRTKLANFKHDWTNGKYTLRDANTRNVAVDSNGGFYFFDLIPNAITENQQSKENSNIYLSKQNGVIYGYAADNQVVINNDNFRIDTPVHEYTHLWDMALQRVNQELWSRGVELMKQTDEWNNVINDPSYSNIKNDENKVASEVHARLSGMIAAGQTIKSARKAKKNFWQKLKEWFSEYKDFMLNNIFNMKKEDCNKVTLEQFLNAPIADFFEQTNPKQIGVGKTEYTQISTQNTNEDAKSVANFFEQMEGFDDSFMDQREPVVEPVSVTDKTQQDLNTNNTTITEQQESPDASEIDNIEQLNDSISEINYDDAVSVNDIKELTAAGETTVEQDLADNSITKENFDKILEDFNILNQSDDLNNAELPENSINDLSEVELPENDTDDINNAEIPRTEGDDLSGAQLPNSYMDDIQGAVAFGQEKIDQLQQNVPDGLNIEDIGNGYDTLRKVDKENTYGVEMDTFKPAITEYSLDDKTKSALSVLGDNYSYIYNLYQASGAFDYVKSGRLKEGDEVYIGYGKVGESTDDKVYNDVLLFTKRTDGTYQMIGTLGYNGKSDPVEARKLRDEVTKLATESSNKKDYFDKITIKTNKAAGNFASGQELQFGLLKHNGAPVKTTVSKILNGSMYFTREQRSLKDVVMSNGVSIGQNLKNGVKVISNIGFFTLSKDDTFKSNLTADEANELLDFKNINSAQLGHVVYIIKKPNGKYQMIPLSIAKFSDLVKEKDNDIVSQIRNVFSDMYSIYTSGQSISIMNDSLVNNTQQDSPMMRLSRLLNVRLKMFYNKGYIHASIVDVDGNKVSKRNFTPKDQRDFENNMYNVLKDCLVNINAKTLAEPEKLNKYIQANVFHTNLAETVLRNSFFTIKPIDSLGNQLKADKDFPDIKILKESQLKQIIMEVAKDNLFSYVVVETNKGTYEMRRKMNGTDAYISCDEIYPPLQQLRMISYAQLKSGIKTDNQDYIESECFVDGKPTELLCHITKTGEKFYYDIETFEQIPSNKQIVIKNSTNTKEQYVEAIPSSSNIDDNANKVAHIIDVADISTLIKKGDYSKLLFLIENNDPVTIIDEVFKGYGVEITDMMFEIKNEYGTRVFREVFQLMRNGILDSENIDKNIIKRILKNNEPISELPDLNSKDDECE